MSQYIKENNINISHFRPGRGRSTPIENFLKEDTIFRNAIIKIRILKEGLLKYTCVLCGLGSTWNGKDLSLQLDHINGISTDNRLSNLRFLCPNCHAQTDTFRGKNSLKAREKRKK
jgi:5-methylcytosine-specific restriction endonuclease McrA